MDGSENKRKNRVVLAGGGSDTFTGANIAYTYGLPSDDYIEQVRYTVGWSIELTVTR